MGGPAATRFPPRRHAGGGRLGRYFGSPEAAILLVGVAAGVLLGPLRGVAGGPVLFAASLVLFAAPGMLLGCRLLAGNLPGPALVPVGFAISTGIFGILGVPALILHASIETYLWASGAVVATSLAAAAWWVLRAADSPTPGHDAPAGSAGLLWAPFACIGGILVFIATRRVPTDNNDIWVYLSWIRGFVDSDRLALRGPYFGERTEGLSRVHINGWLLEQAALARVSGLDPIEMVLRYLTPALVIVALLAVYALATVLLRDARAGVICASVYALFHLVFIEPSVHNIGVELAARVAEDKHAARFLVLPVALIFAVLYARLRKRRYLALFAFSCWTVMVMHPVVLAPLGLCMLGFGLLHVAAEPRRRSSWAVMASLALALWSVVLGPVLLALATGESPVALAYSADINSTPPEVLYATVFVADHWRHIHELDGGSYIMHPWLLLNPAILGSYALGIPFLVWRARRSLAARLLLGGLLVVTVVVYVPAVATFLGEKLVGPNLIWRLAWPIPLLALLTAGWMLWEGLSYAQARLAEFGYGGRAGRVLPLALVAGMVLAVIPPSAAKAVGLYREYELARTANYNPDPVYPWIRIHLQQPSVVLAPDGKSTTLPAYSDAVNVVSYRSEAMVEKREALERISGSKIDFPRRYLDAHHFFSDPVVGERDREILRRYGVDYLMVRAGGPLEEELNTLDGFSPVKAAPRDEYGLYRVNLQEHYPSSERAIAWRGEPFDM